MPPRKRTQQGSTEDKDQETPETTTEETEEVQEQPAPKQSSRKQDEDDGIEVRDVLDGLPERSLHPKDDPRKPGNSVLVVERDQWYETGAYQEHPTNPNLVILVQDVQKAWYPMGTQYPSYSLVYAAGTTLARPRKKK